MSRRRVERIAVPCAKEGCEETVPVLPGLVATRKKWFCPEHKPERGYIDQPCSTEECENTVRRWRSKALGRPICKTCLERGVGKRPLGGEVITCEHDGCDETFYRSPQATKRFCNAHANDGRTGRPADPEKIVVLDCSVEGCGNTVVRWVADMKRRGTKRVICEACHYDGAGMREKGGEIRLCALPGCVVSFYRPPKGTKECCSLKHAGELRRGERSTFVCEHCGDPFHVVPSMAAVNANRFCKKEHEIAWRQTNARLTRKQTSDGYITMWRPEHPNAQPSTGRIMEHVLVVADWLGRALYPGENVHHKNGVKNDNRIENLELWVSSQPSGQRVPDTIAHAVEMLQRYAPQALVPGWEYAPDVANL